MSGESPVQDLEDFSHGQERAKAKWVWAWVPVFDDFVNGFIPAYQVLHHRPDEHPEREG